MFSIARSPLVSPAIVQRSLASTVGYPFPTVLANGRVPGEAFTHCTHTPPTTPHALPIGFTLRLPTKASKTQTPQATPTHTPMPHAGTTPTPKPKAPNTPGNHDLHTYSNLVFAHAAYDTIGKDIELRLPTPAARRSKRNVAFSAGEEEEVIVINSKSKSEFKSCRDRPPTPYPRYVDLDVQELEEELEEDE